MVKTMEKSNKLSFDYLSKIIFEKIENAETEKAACINFFYIKGILDTCANFDNENNKIYVKLNQILLDTYMEQHSKLILNHIDDQLIEKIIESASLDEFISEDTLKSNKFDEYDKNDVTESLKLIKSLTQREYEIFLLLLEDYTFKKCAYILHVKYATINAHTTNIYKKLKVHSRPGLLMDYHQFCVSKNYKY